MESTWGLVYSSSSFSVLQGEAPPSPLQPDGTLNAVRHLPHSSQAWVILHVPQGGIDYMKWVTSGGKRDGCRGGCVHPQRRRSSTSLGTSIPYLHSLLCVLRQKEGGVAWCKRNNSIMYPWLLQCQTKHPLYTHTCSPLKKTFPQRCPTVSRRVDFKQFRKALLY